LPAELADWPACTLGEALLGDLELLTSGAFAPLRGFMDAAEVTAVTEHGTLADGTPWPVPVTLDVPPGALPADATRLVLQDPEGSPLAVLSITERAPDPPDSADSGLVRLAGPVTALREPEHGPFRQLRRRPEDVRAELADGSPGGNVLAYATRRPLNKRHIGQLRHYAGQLNARLLVLPLVCGPAEIVTRPEALVRAVLAARQHLPAGTLVVPVPLAPRGGGPDLDLRAQGIVAAAYGATHLLADSSDVTGSPAGTRNGTLTLPGVPIPVVSAGEWAYDPRSEVWRPLALIETGAEQDELTASELGALLDSGAEVPLRGVRRFDGDAGELAERGRSVERTAVQSSESARRVGHRRREIVEIVAGLEPVEGVTHARADIRIQRRLGTEAETGRQLHRHLREGPGVQVEDAERE
jgi:sulfate adenylyltransferase